MVTAVDSGKKGPGLKTRQVALGRASDVKLMPNECADRVRLWWPLITGKNQRCFSSPVMAVGVPVLINFYP